MRRAPAAWFELFESESMPDLVRLHARGVGSALLCVYAGFGSLVGIAGLISLLVAPPRLRLSAAGIGLFGGAWAAFPWRVGTLTPARLLGLGTAVLAGAALAHWAAGARAVPLGAAIGMLLSYAEAAARSQRPRRRRN